MCRTNLGELRFIAKVVKATNAVLGISVVVIHDEAESVSGIVSTSKRHLLVIAASLTLCRILS